METWVFLTGEYPPQPGGVADHTYLVAEALANSGDTVHVWAPRLAQGASQELPGLALVHRLPAFDAKSLALLEKQLERLTQPIRLVVQYVPHAFGWRGMNLPFCRWLSRQPHPLWVIFHEVRVAFRWTQPPLHNLLAVVTGLMASMVAKSAERIYVTIPAWKPLLPAGSQCRILPVTSNCSTEVDPAHATAVRARLVPDGGTLLGHFGTYGSSITPYLHSALPALLEADSERRVLLLGNGSERFVAEFLALQPACEGRISASGPLPPHELACHLAACDAMLQPYPDGVTGRRGSLLAPLALGLPIVTTSGHLTEPFWRDSNAVVLVPADCGGELSGAVDALLRDGSLRVRLAANARGLYRDKFALQHTIDALRS